MNAPESTPSLHEAAQRAYDYYVGLLYKGELKPEDEAQYNHLREKEKAGEIQPSSERRVITDEEALATLVRAQEGQESTARFDLWIDQLQLETDKTPGGLGRIECAIRRASVYYRAGFKDKAIGDLEDTQRAALCEPEKPADLDQKIASLLDRMRADQSIV
jgi:hypothetical protein